MFGVILGVVGAIMAFATELVGTRRLGSRADAYLTSGGRNVLAAVGGLGIVGVVVVVLIVIVIVYFVRRA